MKDEPNPADSTVVFDKKHNEWIFCPSGSCRRRLFYVYSANAMIIQIKCGKCGHVTRIVIGVELAID